MARNVFSAAEIRELAHHPQVFLNRSDDQDSGYGYPQLSWRYRAVGALHGADRDARAAEAYLEQALIGGRGATLWKQRQLGLIKDQISRVYTPLDRAKRRPFVRTLFESRPRPVTWMGHSIALPLGFVFGEPSRQYVRLIWTEKNNRFERRGTIMLAAATLAYAEQALGAMPAGIEVFQLREHEQRLFETRDLRAMWPRLDQLLSWAERRPLRPPAA